MFSGRRSGTSPRSPIRNSYSSSRASELVDKIKRTSSRRRKPFQGLAPIVGGLKRLILTTLMFAVSSSRHKNALLARERFRMAATEQGRRHDHQNDG